MNKPYTRTTISISKQNYEKLKSYGFASESMNDALTMIFKKLEQREDD